MTKLKLNDLDAITNAFAEAQNDPDRWLALADQVVDEALRLKGGSIYIRISDPQGSTTHVRPPYPAPDDLVNVVRSAVEQNAKRP